jgi:hypothetical protein
MIFRYFNDFQFSIFKFHFHFSKNIYFTFSKIFISLFQKYLFYFSKNIYFTFPKINKTKQNKITDLIDKKQKYHIQKSFSLLQKYLFHFSKNIYFHFSKIFIFIFQKYLFSFSKNNQFHFSKNNQNI